ncbi:MAG: hypothetical protein PHF86_10235 [Candidatus Nanoarchaeia archaeon]|nr:hypothetical protein [Candidatus Nanoarchaeia archaeon]
MKNKVINSRKSFHKNRIEITSSKLQKNLKYFHGDTIWVEDDYYDVEIGININRVCIDHYFHLDWEEDKINKDL